MRNKAFLNMKTKFRIYLPNAYLIRRLRNIAIFCPFIFLSSYAVGNGFSIKSVKELKQCGATYELPNSNLLNAMFSKNSAARTIIENEAICEDLNDQKRPYLCAVGQLARSPMTTRTQITQMLSKRKFGNDDAIKADIFLLEKFIPFGKKSDVYKLLEKPSAPKNFQFWRLNGQSPDHTGGAGDPPKNLPNDSRIAPDFNKPIAIDCSDPKECCWKSANLYEINRDPRLGKDIFVQRANLQAVGAILPLENGASSLKNCSMVMLSKTLAITATHCVVPSTELKDGFLTTTDSPKDSVLQLRWAVWTPKAANPEMKSAKEEFDTVCKPGATSEQKAQCNFTQLTKPRLLFPIIDPSGKPQQVPDIALVQFDSFDNAIPDWAFAKLDAQPPENPSDKTLTSIGFGNTDIALCKDGLGSCVTPTLPYGPQIGWLPDEITKDKKAIIASQYIQSSVIKGSNQKTMACPGDSGGGLFSGYHDGDEKDQMSLVGIVSALIGSQKPPGCSSSVTQWVSPHAFRSEICGALNKVVILDVGLKPFCGELGKP
jgi:hypothetical protein